MANRVSLRAATFTAVASGTVDAQGLAAAAGRVLHGINARENAGTPAAATVILRHGTADTDPILCLIELAADASKDINFGPNGIAAPNGVFVDRVTGTTELVLYHSQ